MLERNKYLSSKAFNFYVVATILALMSLTLGSVVDSIIVGRLIGTEALTAVNLSSPLLQLMMTVMLLLNSGTSLSCSFALGKSDYEKANRYFSLAMLMNVGVGLIFTFIGVFYSEGVTDLLCSEESLKPLVNDYVSIILLTFPFYLLMPGLSLFVRAGGAPKLTTVAFTTANALNLVLDIIFIKYFDMGILGSSWATSIGYIVGVLIMCVYFFRDSSVLRWVWSFAGLGVGKTMLLGIPMAISSALLTMRFLGVNHIIGLSLGAFGLAVVSVCMNLLKLLSTFVAGTSQSMQPSGAFMLGQEDNKGFRFLVGSGFKFMVACLTTLVVFFMVVPEVILELFGFNDAANMAEAKTIVRVVVPSFLLYAINYLLMVVFQLTKKIKMSIFISVIQPIAILPLMLLSAAFLPTEYIWWSFVGGELLVLILILLVSRCKFLPQANDKQRLELSLDSRADGEQYKKMIDVVEEFLKSHFVEERTAYHTKICCDEVISNIIKYSYTDKKKHYIDLIVLIEEDKIRLSIKDDGRAFDPIKHENDLTVGIPLFKKLCSEIEYKYLNGQNMVFVTLITKK